MHAERLIMQSTTPIQKRRAHIVELIAQGQGTSQQSLVDALGALGVSVTQATLSRDLRDLGAQKGPGGYVLPGGSESPLVKALRTWLTSAVAAQNQVVLGTPPGGASPLAVVLDAAEHSSILGTIAGDDTILIITPSSKLASALAQEFSGHVSGGASQ